MPYASGVESDSASDAQSPPLAYPTDASAYELVEEIGRGVSATVRASGRARARTVHVDRFARVGWGWGWIRARVARAGARDGAADRRARDAAVDRSGSMRWIRTPWSRGVVGERVLTARGAMDAGVEGDV